MNTEERLEEALRAQGVLVEKDGLAEPILGDFDQLVAEIELPEPRAKVLRGSERSPGRPLAPSKGWV